MLSRVWQLGCGRTSAIYWLREATELLCDIYRPVRPPMCCAWAPPSILKRSPFQCHRFTNSLSLLVVTTPGCLYCCGLLPEAPNQLCKRCAAQVLAPGPYPILHTINHFAPGIPKHRGVCIWPEGLAQTAVLVWVPQLYLRS